MVLLSVYSLIKAVQGSSLSCIGQSWGLLMINDICMIYLLSHSQSALISICDVIISVIICRCICFVICEHCSSYGDRTFAATGPRLWNFLPVKLCNPDITYGLFRRQLKGHLFGNHGHGARWLLICSALEKHLLTYLLSLDVIAELTHAYNSH